jgi:hypothetical protein
MTMNRIAIWLVEDEVGGGLPAERTYSHSYLGKPIGHVVLPETMRADRRADHIVFSSGPEHVASLSTCGVVAAAIAGEFGLSWLPAGGG